MYARLIRFSLRVVAWISGILFLTGLFVLILLSNANTLVPSLINSVSARINGEITYGEFGLGWVDDTIVMQIANLKIERETPQEQFEFSADRIEILATQPSLNQSYWQLARIDVQSPKLISHRSGAAPVRQDRKSPVADTDDIPGSLGFLTLIRQLNVTEGEYEFSIENGDKQAKFAGNFGVAARSNDELKNLSVALTSHEHEDTLVSLVLQSAKQADGSESTELKFAAKFVEFARLASFLPDNAATARLDLSNIEAEVNANVYGHWQGQELNALDFSVELNDPNLDGNIPNVEQARLHATGKLHLVDAKPSHIDVDFRLESLDLAAVSKQIPGAFTPKFYKHLSERLQSLWFTELSGKFSGNPQSMFKPDGSWNLTADGKLANFTYRFGTNWPPLENGEGTYEIRGKKLTIAGTKGFVFGQPIKHAAAKIDDITVADPILTVSAGIDMPASAAIDLFGKDGMVSPGKLDWIASASGAGEVELNVDIPLRRGKEFTVSGAMKLAGVEMTTSQGITGDEIAGQMAFNRFGITSGKLKGQALDGPFETEFTGSGAKGSFVLEGRSNGRGDAVALKTVLGEPVSARVSGNFDWAADFRFAPEQSQVDVSASLVDIVSVLPFPLKKGAGADLPLSISVRTKDKSSRTTDLSLGPHVKATVESSLRDRKWHTDSGLISIGKPLPVKAEKSGLVASVNLPELDYGAWSSLARDSDSDQGSGDFSSALKSVEIKADALLLAGQRKLHNAQVSVDKKETHWDVSMSTDTVKGVGRYKSLEFVHEGESPVLEIDLSICHIPASTGAATGPPTDPAKLPVLKLRCMDTRYGQYTLGESLIEAQPGPDSWQITRAQFASPSYTMEVEGDWFYSQHTDLNFKLNSVDFGSTLNELGFPARFKRGKTEITGTLGWDAALTQWASNRTSGALEVKSEEGVILSDTGSQEALKVVGVLNYDTIFRRFSNDIVDVLDEDGILYDHMTGSATIKNGIFEVDGVFIDGPSLAIAMTGTTSWNKKQHNLIMGVEPKLKKSFTTLATLLINPITGALVYAGGKLADQVKVKFSYQYEVTGPWDKPKVSLVDQSKTKSSQSNSSSLSSGN